MGLELIFVLIAIALGSAYYFKRSMTTPKVDIQAREAFVSRFDPWELRTNRFDTDEICRILKTTDTTFTAVVVWRGNGPVAEGEEFVANKDQFGPFGKAEFLGRG